MGSESGGVKVRRGAKGRVEDAGGGYGINDNPIEEESREDSTTARAERSNQPSKQSLWNEGIGDKRGQAHIPRGVRGEIIWWWRTAE